ncbi:BREX-3 system P-loop-containing protein BrxF [Mesorhizobium sp. M0664]|uniref:BREX-3 system P-loop-containing protein BrxF n=1 Tax=Mesorhizobium sp. M0664 TaxID=2956982 RepID=UPI0033363800
MSRSLASQIQDVLPKTSDTYYKLILTVGPARAGKTAAISELAATHKWPRVNVNLSLAERLLALTHRQRAVRAAGILDDIVSAKNSSVVLLDNIELLFATELAQDPLKLLQSLSRNRTIVAAWPGDFEGANLTYAAPGHPEARRYLTPQAVIVKAGEADRPDNGLPREETK